MDIVLKIVAARNHLYVGFLGFLICAIRLPP